MTDQIADRRIAFSGKRCSRYASSILLVLNLVLGLASSANAIVDGKDVDAQDPLAKSTVLLAIPRGMKTFEFCSGTLISKKSILTAGHCVTLTTKDNVDNQMEPGQIQIYFGNGQLGQGFLSAKIITQAVRGHIRKIHRHPEFRGVHTNPDGTQDLRPGHELANDLAVIILSDPSPDAAVPANFLPDDFQLSAGQDVGIAGYGKSSSADGLFASLAAILRTTDGIVTTPSEFPSLVKLESSGGSEGGGACGGDSGGPAFITQNKLDFVWGVASRANCFGESYYTDLRPYRAWIMSVME